MAQILIFIFNAKRIYLVLLIFLQLLVILYLIILIALRIESGTNESIYPIEAKDYNFPVSASLRYFYEPKPNSQRTDSREWLSNKMTYHFNSEGFYNSTDFSIKKPPGIFRIITLGDSNTFGAYVDILDNYPSKLTYSLMKNCQSNKFEVINLGVPGYDITYAIEHYLQRGQKFSPDLIIWLIKEDDIFQINDLIRESSLEIREKLKSSGALKKFEEKGNFYPHRTIAEERLVLKLGRENILNIQEHNLEKFTSIYPGKLLIFTYPYRLSSYNSLLEKYSQNRMLTYYYNQLPAFNKTQQLADGHPNPNGYQLIADNLLNFIQSNKIVPCNN